MKRCWKILVLFTAVASQTAFTENFTPTPEMIRFRLEKEYPNLFELYKHLHTHPELSFQEEKTADRIAGELRQIGFEVTTNIGGHGVVGVLKNGNGPTILVRTDLDALPVKEQTGLS